MKIQRQQQRKTLRLRCLEAEKDSQDTLLWALYFYSIFARASDILKYTVKGASEFRRIHGCALQFHPPSAAEDELANQAVP